MESTLASLSITEAAHKLRTRECTVRELWDACHTAAQSDALHAYLEVFAADEAAIVSAQARIDAEGENAPLLCGIPLAIKDNILIKGKIASAASKMLENYEATYDATAIKKLRDAGALFVGRTNMDEFALGGSTENSAFGPTMNPHDAGRVAGGTSGGSAAAVAANIAIASLGSDTGGSVRNPASYCGVVGFKPTYGSISRSGLIAAASSFDQIGPITKTVADAKTLFDVLKGTDTLDSSTAPEGSYPTFSKEVSTIGVPRTLLEQGLDPDVVQAFNAALEATGCKIVDIEIPSNKPALAAYYIINFAEVSTNLSRLDGMRYGHAARGATLLDDYVLSRTEGFGKETKRRILLGTFVLSAGYIDAYYRKAVAARSALIHEFDEAFKQVDVIATPTMPTPAFKMGEKSDPLSLYLEDVFTVTANLTGMPAISVPMGTVDREGTKLPIGIQFTAPRGADERLFTIGAAVTGEQLY
ncbi:MAG: aspartyl/glutamyl-tRNA(Asn/Gln) amidotransferase, A subunit [Parcubacteria bacterium C7867-007]|nr:MAG: aspartyl/glutamyl-tRNA(Asn/Gln) amidotransferase, A subunit [Parcubacteria bacterium C7867-007]